MTDKSNILLAGVVIALLIIAGLLGFVAVKFNPIEGAPGVQGSAGLMGPEGPIGPIGLPGANGINGINGADGVQGLIGPKGNQGNQGNPGEIGPQGITGIDGLNGIDGVDLEPNDVPVIVVNDFDSYVEGCGKYDDYWFNLNITTADTENDLRKVSLYYKWDESHSWKLEKTWPFLTDTDVLVDWEENKGFEYGENTETLYWLVECMDGENLIYLNGNTSLTKPVCI